MAVTHGTLTRRKGDLLWVRGRAMEAASNGIVICDAGRIDLPIVDVNPAFERITGYAADEVIGRNCRFLQGAETDSESAARMSIAIRAGHDIALTLLNYRKDGTPFWNELYVAPVHDAAGRLTHFVGVQTDVTARRRAEDRVRFLAEASALLGTSLDYEETLAQVARLAVPAVADWCAVDVVDDGGTARPVALVHADPNQVDEARRMRERYPVRATGEDGVAAVLRTGRAALLPEVTDAMVAAAQDDEHLAALRRAGLRSVMVVPLSARGRVLGAVTFASTRPGRRYDADDLALAEDLAGRAAIAIDNARLVAQARAAVRARDQFLSIAAHELRTPVASIKGYAQTLLRAQTRATLAPERLASSLRTINAASNRLAELTNDLLDVSLIRLGQLPLRQTTVDIGRLVADLVADYGQLVGEQRRIAVTVPPLPVVVRADAGRLDQVVTNLLDNAIKYAPQGEEIVVSVGQEPTGRGAEAIVRVRDRGIGLASEDRERVFEPFDRAATATEANIPGMGLGLYICRSILERHGGRIWAESDGEGMGATVSFALPVVDDWPATG